MSQPRRWTQRLPFTPAQSTNATNSSFKRTTGRGACPYYNLMFVTVMWARETCIWLSAYHGKVQPHVFQSLEGSPAAKP